MIKSGFSDKWLEELKSRINIIDVIGSYTTLTRKGKNYWACCPFHTEKTPSFAINEMEQYYHCFGCHAGGDVIRFVMEIESVSFYEAVKMLAERAGIPLPEIKEDENIIAHKKKVAKMTELMRDTAKHYHSNLRLPDGQKALQYLRGRGFKDSTIVKFGLGVSAGFTEVVDHLKSLGYSEQLMLEAGVVNVSKDRYFDHLSNRVITPIFNQYGEVVAFGGRELEKSGYGKYQNTINTPLFDKSKTLYGLNFVRNYKKNNPLDSIIVVEGYMDVISLAQAGIENVVASMGTSFTQYQARLLKKLVSKVYTCFDGDLAGQEATLRGLDILRSENIDVLVISIPDDMDPDEYIKAHGVDAFKGLISSALPLIEYKLYLAELGLDPTNPTSRSKYVEKALSVLKELPTEAEREVYLPIISEKSGITFGGLKNTLESGRFTDSASTLTREEPKKNNVDKDKDMSYYTPARFVLYSLIREMSYAELNEDLLPYLEDDTHRDLYRYYVECKQNGVKLITGNMFTAVEDEKEAEAILSPSCNSEDNSISSKYFVESLASLKRRYVDKMVADLNERIRVEPDKAKRSELLSILNELILKR
ncbi:MAG: DNA primase [Clostridia bacterium]|nr:DNA primase [Clostridia bacterium]